METVKSLLKVLLLIALLVGSVFVIGYMAQQSKKKSDALNAGRVAYFGDTIMFSGVSDGVVIIYPEYIDTVRKIFKRADKICRYESKYSNEIHLFNKNIGSFIASDSSVYSFTLYEDMNFYVLVITKNITVKLDEYTKNKLALLNSLQQTVAIAIKDDSEKFVWYIDDFKKFKEQAQAKKAKNLIKHAEIVANFNSL